MEVGHGRTSVGTAPYPGSGLVWVLVLTVMVTVGRQVRGLQTGRGKYRGARPNDDTRLLIPRMSFRRLVSLDGRELFLLLLSWSKTNPNEPNLFGISG